TSILAELFFIAGIVAACSSFPPESRILSLLNTATYIFGKSIRHVATGFFVFWVLLKLGIRMTLEGILGTDDVILMIVMLLYVLGNVVMDFAIGYVEGDINRGIRSAISAGFLNMLFISIVSVILMAINFVGPTWSSFNSILWHTTAILFVGALLSIFIIRGELEIRPMLRDIEIGSNIYRLDRTKSIIPTENVEIVVKNGDFVVPVEREDEVLGYYISGEVSYNVDLGKTKIIGEASRMMILSFSLESIEEIGRDLYFVSRPLGEGGLIFDLQRDAEEFLETIRYKFKRDIDDIVRLPFVHVISGKNFDYVKVGPILVLDSKDKSYVSVGPIKVVSGDFRQKTEGVDMVIILDDIERGRVVFSIKGSKIDLSWDDIEISRGLEKMSFRRGKAKYIRKRNEIIIGWSGNIIKLREKKIKIVSGEKVVVVSEDKIKIILGSNVEIIKNDILADQIRSYIEEKIDEFSKKILSGGAVKIIAEILNTVDDIISTHI
ncbi:MAG: hypothetical protein Q6363_002255, partial [Candidatus Njordarchaeota archaeon]